MRLFSVDSGHSGKAAEASLGIEAQYGSAGLDRVGRDDQIVYPPRRSGPVYVRDQPSMVNRRGLGVVQHIKDRGW